MINKPIYLDSPNLGNIEKKFLCEAIDSGYVSTFGPYTTRFEKEILKLLQTKNVVSIQNGTAALFMALYELGIGQGDEVILPVITFVACANVIKYLGAKPIFVDIDFKSWNISLKKIQQYITPKTKAIMPVHLYGNPCDMNNLLKIAKENHLFIIEDATESLLSKYNNQYTGTFGDFGVFSFNGNKLITTGGGGMLVGKQKKRVNHIRFLINQAKDEKNASYHSEVGFNLRLTNIVAALGLAQLKRINDFKSKKKIFREIYEDTFRKIDEISLQESYSESDPVWWLNGISIDKKDTSIHMIQDELKVMGIPTRRLFSPIIEFPCYSVDDKDTFYVAYEKFHNSIILPGSTLNDEKSIRYVAQQIVYLLTRKKRF